MKEYEKIIQLFVENNFKLFTGVPADSINAIYEGVRKYSKELTVISPRHEGSASLIASAYCKISYFRAFCTATAGPGVGHLPIGLFDAVADYSAPVAIAGLSNLEKRNIHAFQDIETAPIFSSIGCDYQEYFPKIGAKKLNRMIKESHFLQVPFVCGISTATLESTLRAKKPNFQNVFVGEQQIQLDMNILDSVKRYKSILLIGDSSGLSKKKVSNVIDIFQTENTFLLSESIQNEWWDSEFERLPSFSNENTFSDNFPDCEQVLVVGRMSYNLKRFLDKNIRVMHIDIHIDRNQKSNFYFYLDIENAQEVSKIKFARIEKLNNFAQESSGEKFMSGLNKVIPKNAICCFDFEFFKDGSIVFFDKKDRIITSSFGAEVLGYPICAALAANVAFPERQIFCFYKNQNYINNFQELFTFKKYGYKVIFINFVNLKPIQGIGVRNTELLNSILDYRSFEKLSDFLPFLNVNKYQNNISFYRFIEEKQNNLQLPTTPNVKEEITVFEKITEGKKSTVKKELLMSLYTSEGVALAASAHSKLSRGKTVIILKNEVDVLESLNGIFDAIKDFRKIIIVAYEQNWAFSIQDIFGKKSVKVLNQIEKKNFLQDILDISISNEQCNVYIVADTSSYKTLSLSQEKKFLRNKNFSSNRELFKNIIEEIKKAKYPVIVAGGGSSSAVNEVIQLSKLILAPIVGTMATQGLFEMYESFVGFAGSSGHKSSQKITDKSDCLIVLGVSNAGSSYSFLRNSKLKIDVNDSFDIFERTELSRYTVLLDVKIFLKELNATLNKQIFSKNKSRKIMKYHQNFLKYSESLSQNSYINDVLKPSSVIATINDFVKKRDVHIFADVGVNTLWLFRFIQPGVKITWTRNFASMGFGVMGVIVGATFHRNTYNIAVVGDGGLGMLLPEILHGNHLSERFAVVIVLDNSSLVAIRYEQEISGWPEYESSLDNNGITELLTSAKVNAYTATTSSEITKLLKLAKNKKGLTIIRVICSPDEPPTPTAPISFKNVVNLFLAWGKQGKKGMRSAIRTIPGLWKKYN